MSEEDDFRDLGKARIPAPRNAARMRALESAMASFDGAENFSTAPKASAAAPRLTDRAQRLWSRIMQTKLIANPALAGLAIALPLAGIAAWQLMGTSPFAINAPLEQTTEKRQAAPVEPSPAEPAPKVESVAPLGGAQSVSPAAKPETFAAESEAPGDRSGRVNMMLQPGSSREAMPVAPAPAPRMLTRQAPQGMVNDAARSRALTVMPEPQAQVEDRDRIQSFDSNPVKSAQETPVSTLSIDTDTASYSYVRRSLKEGILPSADTVRVEEMVNYFPYDWQGPDGPGTPFNTTVSVMPTPWNAGTKLMHVAIKGYDVAPAARPLSNLVFLIDVSGSMNAPDKLPLLKASFRMLVNQMGANDTVSIVTYAGAAGTVLEPTKGSEKQTILDAIDRLEPGGSTAGAAGIEEAYRLAQASFVKDGVNRVMLATDGDFNVGQSDDAGLKRLIEEKRQSGVFLSVLGFGRGNLNDQMMQEIAQNGNGTAAYIDTLAEAEKVLVEEAHATLFPIAKDVKIQVEFNPATIAEYRLIGYETRALKREDFNNDRVDAGEIGSGHAVTAIYEITPKGSPAQAMDDLRYGEAATSNPGGIANAGEYAFVKIRYKAPDADTSQLITTPVSAANEVAGFDQAGTDQRFSVAVVAFGQKLRGESQVAGFGYDRITEIATAARGNDPFGYRAEFLSLVRLASGLDGRK